MYRLLLFPFLALFLSCDSKSGEATHNSDYKSAFDSILTNYDMQGSILIYDPQQKDYHSNDFEWAQRGFLPASTFKIPNAIIALETAVMKSDTSTINAMPLREAFQTSCVPCFQEIARRVGTAQMKTYLNKLHYGDMDVTSENTDSFWLKGKSHISSFEQIDFLTRFITKKLPILNSTRESMLKILTIEESKAYKLSGKTGLYAQENEHNGWFVGFLQKENKTYYFALNAIPKESSAVEEFIDNRKPAIYDALKAMKLL